MEVMWYIVTGIALGGMYIHGFNIGYRRALVDAGLSE